MDYSNYEEHIHLDPVFPIIFHLDILGDSIAHMNMYVHWHESMELLYILEGTARVTCGFRQITARPGDTVVINGNEIHRVEAEGLMARYYCLIPDYSVYGTLQMEMANAVFQNYISQDKGIGGLIHEIAAEQEEPQFGSKEKIKALVVELGIHLARRYSDPQKQEMYSRGESPKILLVKRALDFIKGSLERMPSVDEICTRIGVSKYYFCRTFKEVTGRTLVDYMNLLRCRKAVTMLSTGRFSVGETAERLCFGSQQYFTRVYRKFVGRLPSETLHAPNGTGSPAKENGEIPQDSAK